jgi:hypothetical protein
VLTGELKSKIDQVWSAFWSGLISNPLMVEMTGPGPHDEICDPACDTRRFLVASAQYVERTHRDLDELERIFLGSGIGAAAEIATIQGVNATAMPA